MRRFLFNRRYFDETFYQSSERKRSQDEKLEKIENETGIGLESCRSKLIYKKRSISKDNYDSIKKVDPLLLLDTEKLKDKLILRANLDFTSNERFVLFLMLSYLDEGEENVTIKALTDRISNGIYNLHKIEHILHTCRVVTDPNGTKEKLFHCEHSEKGNQYSLNLDALICYTDL